MLLTLEEGGTTELIDDLRNERIDAAFIRTTIASQEGLVVTPLLQEAMVLALPRAHVLAKRASGNKAVPLKALAGETFIVYRRHNGPGLYDSILSACNAAGFSPRVEQEAPRIVSTLDLVAAGLRIPCSRVLTTHADGRCRLPPVVRRRAAERSALSRVAARRELGGSP